MKDAGECRDWRKVMTLVGRQVNQERWRLFENKRTGAR
jgi:hypothetical protein